MISFKRTITTLTAVAALVAVVLSAPAKAQCIGDDGLNTGNCYQVVQANLPQFPALRSLGQWVPYRNCSVGNAIKTSLGLPAPQQIACGYYTMTGVRLRDANTGMLLWDPSALWLMVYSRTWMETPVINNQPQRVQVWRFLVNADVKPSNQLMAAHPVHDPNFDYLIPASVYNGNPQPVHYSGYIDYAYNCSTNRWSFVFGVQHACDVFTHNPFSAYPLGGHPNWSYVTVAPSNFTPSTTLPGITGTIMGDGMRMYRFGNWPRCESEQPITNAGAMQRIQRKCPCGPTPSLNGQFIEYVSRARSDCRSSAVSITPFNALWGGSVQMSVGTFTDPNSYPGQESLYFNWDPTFYVDGRTNTQSIELFVGVGTQKGWPAISFHPNPLGQVPQMVDMVNVLLLPNLTMFSGMAGFHASDKILSYNVY